MLAALRAAFFAEKAPYLLTLFVALIGWLVTYTASRYERAPLVEYAIDDADGQLICNGATAKEFITTMRNISPSASIACVRILFSARSPGSDTNVSLEKGELVHIAGPTVFPVFNKLPAEEIIVFQMDLHPGAAIAVPVSTTIPARLSLALAQCELPSGQPSSGSLPVLLASSWQTWLIRHSLSVLWVGGVLFAVSLCLIYIMVWRAAHGSSQRADCDAVQDAMHSNDALKGADLNRSEGP